jgi:hypothetical protein
MDFYTFDEGLFDDLETTSVQYLTFAVALEAYLSNASGVDVWPLHVPQFATTYPQLTYRLKKRDSNPTLNGPPTKLVGVTYIIEAVGTNKLDALNLSEQLRGVLHGYRGAFGGLILSGCRRKDRGTGYASTNWNSSMGTYIIPSTFRFMYIRST